MPISTAVDNSAVAKTLGIQTNFKDLRGGSILYLPQRIAVVGQGASASVYSLTKQQVTSAFQAGTLYGFGSPIHLAVSQLLPRNGDGVGTIPVTIYPLEDDDDGVASSGDITPSGTQTVSAEYVVLVNNIRSEPFVILASASVATRVASITTAINSVLEMPIIATNSTTKVDIDAKWAGVSSNDIVIEIVGSTTAGTAFAITQPTGGLVNPNVDSALAQMGDIWETLVLNCLDIADTTTLGKFTTLGEGRWGALVRKPLIVFTGNNETTVSNATAVSDARKTDRVNAQLVAPASNDLPFVIASKQLARIAVVANNNPARGYGGQKATGLTAGADGSQWTYPDRDSAVKKGSSTIEVKDSVVNISDVVTFYHPSGDQNPAYRYVVNLVKLQNIIFNTNLIFSADEWNDAPLIPDGQPTVNPEAKNPSMAKAAVATMLQYLADNAIISDVDYAKNSIMVEIDAQNPNRLNIAFTVKLSGNIDIISIDLNFGFYFGIVTAV